jgi:hypothetical protein
MRLNRRIGAVALRTFFTCAVIAAAGCADSAPDLPTTLEGIALDTVFEVGRASGASFESFQGIWDVELDGDERLALLDLGGPSVHVYDAHGAHLASLEDAGLEEGQIDGPTGIAWSEAGELAVWDPGASWISTFRIGGRDLDFIDRRRAFAFGETGFCAAGGRAFVSYYGFQDGNVVHEIGPEGPIHSFGAAPAVAGAGDLGPDLQEIATEELTPSALHCSARGVLEVGFVQSIVRLHDYDGVERWRRTLDDFRPIVAYSEDGIGLGRAFDEGQGSHLLRSVVPWGTEYVLVQHQLRMREIPEASEPEVIETRLLRLSDGVEVARTRTLPLVLAAEGRRLALLRPGTVAGVTVAEVR